MHKTKVIIFLIGFNYCLFLVSSDPASSASSYVYPHLTARQITTNRSAATTTPAKIKMLNLSLRRKYFEAIKSGKKTVEGRLNSSEFKDLKPGTQMSFTAEDTNEVMICIVKAINIYPSFTDMLKGEGVENMLPGIQNLKEGVEIYESFPEYKKKVKKKGALAIRIKMCSDRRKT